MCINWNVCKMRTACLHGVVLVVLAIGLAGAGDLELGLEPNKYETLLDWIQDLGGGLHGVSPQAVPGMGMGMVADIHLQDGAIVSRTPLSAVINIEHALVSEEFGPLADQLDYLSSTNLKALFVAYERQRGDSFWQPFLDSIPSHIPTTLFFSDEDLAELQASLVKDFSVKQRAAARKAFEGVRSNMERFPDLFPDFKEEHFYWGIAAWSSRAHRIRVRDQDDQWQTASCLVPLADLFNMAVREGSSNVKCATNDASTHFECYTLRPVPAGTQLLVEYATEPDMRHNGRLLLHFGFVARGNPYDSVSIKSLNVSPELPYYSTRKELTQRLHSMHQEFFQLSRPTASNPTVAELIKMMRLMVGTISEIKRAAKLPQPFSETLGPRSEKRALREAVQHLGEILSAYETTAEEDEELLASEQLQSVNRMHAVVLRLEEKLIIQDNIAFLEQQLASISRERTEL